jgi:hypothetical protein
LILYAGPVELAIFIPFRLYAVHKGAALITRSIFFYHEFRPFSVAGNNLPAPDTLIIIQIAGIKRIDIDIILHRCGP